MRGFLAVLRKEAIHMRRDKGTLRLALGIPVFQLILFGSIDTNVTSVPTVVFDQCRCPESRALLDELVATKTFRIARDVSSRAALRDAIVAGDAKVGLEIPPDYGRHRLEGTQATFLALIDGSDNTIASQSLAAIDGWALTRSLQELQQRTGFGDAAQSRRDRKSSSTPTRAARISSFRG